MGRKERKAVDAGRSRLGGEIPLFSDRYREQRRLAANWLAFSHGRAALAWLIERKKPKAALICAYTCPSVPAFLRRSGLAVSFFDVGTAPDEVVALAKRSRGPCLVLIPALFGSPPWLDAAELAAALRPSGIVVIDAAQTAFGHNDYSPPPGGATLSCPRKTTALCDGAILAVGRGVAPGRSLDRLPVAAEAIAWKQAARALWATRDPDFEIEALDFNRRSEEAWPDRPHRMSSESRALLARMDAQWHRTMRRRNRQALVQALAGRLPIWAPDRGTPFSLPVFAKEPAELIAALGQQRVFASRLWPDAEHDPQRHPAAAYLVRHLVSLPLDQRHSTSDMMRIAAATLSAKARPAPPPAELRRMIEF